jgi:uncharacterized repeat protein (TIGR01451 family)
MALLSLGSTAWATPDQNADHGTVTVAPIKSVDKTLVNVGDVAIYEILLNNHETGYPWTWDDVMVTDTIDPRLRIYGIMTTQGSVEIDGQDVTVTIGDMPPGASNTVTIYVAVDSGDPGDLIGNMAYVPRPGYEPLAAMEPVTMTIGIPAYVPLTFKSYSAP